MTDKPKPARKSLQRSCHYRYRQGSARPDHVIHSAVNAAKDNNSIYTEAKAIVDTDKSSTAWLVKAALFSCRLIGKGRLGDFVGSRLKEGFVGYVRFRLFCVSNKQVIAFGRK
jgi:hypothetical protein